MSRARYWMVTYQVQERNQKQPVEWFEKETKIIHDELKESCTWAVAQFERGKKKKRAHMHVGLYLKHAKTMSAIKKMEVWHQSPNVQKALGTPQQLATYVRKEEGRICEGFEFGTPPVQGQRNDLQIIMDRLKGGEKVRTVAEEYVGQFARYTRFFYECAGWFKPEDCEKMGIIIFGDTGTGKTTAIRKIGDNYKKIMPDWFDGYGGEEIIRYDEFEPEEHKLGYMNMMYDEDPMRIAIKGSSLWSRHNTVAITSNTDPAYWWRDASGRNTQQRQGFLDRQDFIIEMRRETGVTFHRGTEEEWLELGYEPIKIWKSGRKKNKRVYKAI